MKNSAHLILMAALALLVSSCFSSRPSTSKFSMIATMEASADGFNASFFKDSLLTSRYLRIDNLCFLVSKVEDDVFQGGWHLSLLRDSLAKDGTLCPYASAGRGAGYGNSRVYAAFYDNPDPALMADYDVIFNFEGYPVHNCKVLGCLLTNSSAVLKAVGDGLFAKGDFLQVTATGYLGGKAVGTPASLYLVDYRGDTPKVVTDWEVFDLRKAAPDIDALKFDITTSKPEIPRYFCMDNFAADVYLEY